MEEALGDECMMFVKRERSKARNTALCKKKKKKNNYHIVNFFECDDY